ncbi:SMP-30/gluconolactonase/LRE family protein [Altererythrobacter indicus]|uniref:SMP-30/gluconolactonase/LRE family protein n=2 Tax=Altericroceibacterium indicum TaxID=374177 RepID=A0A845A4R7_9SPHN|nr:SMP-30/gluconolactonase/LRE family protein [Altericroceibacterium indicum]
MGGMATLPSGLARAAVKSGGGTTLERVGGITRFDPELEKILDVNAPVEVLATGYSWAEGPAWVPTGGSDGKGYLLFNDPPNNIMYIYTPQSGVETFLSPSGLVGPVPKTIREAGANGMALDLQGGLVVADSGTRAIARIDLTTKRKTILASTFEGRRFNSPNDVAVSRDGIIYFTDPPYGLVEAEASPLRELDFNGLYRLSPDGEVKLLGQYHRPNGVGLSPDERTLYLSLSDEKRPEVLAYSLDAQGMPTGPARLFNDMRVQFAEGKPGLPDGMEVDPRGYVFATGPGGVHICAPDGRLLGMIATDKAVANCAIGDRGKTLYLTSASMLARVSLRG